MMAEEIWNYILSDIVHAGTNECHQRNYETIISVLFNTVKKMDYDFTNIQIKPFLHFVESG